MLITADLGNDINGESESRLKTGKVNRVQRQDRFDFMHTALFPQGNQLELEGSIDSQLVSST